VSDGKKKDPKASRTTLSRRSFLGGSLAGVLFTVAGAPMVNHERKRQAWARRPRPVWIGHM
jgi:hypothetical protein